MRSFRRLIVLGVFVAVGVGLAISVGSSMAPSNDDLACRSTPCCLDEVLPDTTPCAVPNESGQRFAHESPVLPSTNGANPAYAKPLAALTEDRGDNQPPPGISSIPLEALKALLGTQNQAEAAEPIAKPQAESAPKAAEPKKDDVQRNSIHRTHSAKGDRFDINIRDAGIREVLDLLSKEGYLNILASPKVQGKVSATLNNVRLDEALNAILKSTGFVSRHEGNFIFVGEPQDFLLMAQAADQINTRIYHPSYVTSGELKNLITPILTQGVGVISVTTKSESGIPANLTDAGGDNFAGGDALLVRDYEAVLCEVDRLVAEVDLRPLQVHIEAMILSVKLDDSNKFGVNFQLLRQFDHLKFGWGTIPDALSDVKFDGGLKFGFLDQTLGSFINALESVGDTNVIATPRLMVLNKHAAEIQIGREEGYVNTTQTETAATQTVEMLALGTILRIRPFVSNDGIIRLEVHPEISDGSVTVEGNFTLPHKEITQVTTNVMVRDGCTAVIGGLIQDKQHVVKSQVPLLGSLPVVGVAFRQTTEETDRHELIVLITPNVVHERPAYREGAIQACSFQRRQSTYAEKMNPLTTRSLCRRYIRRAKLAWSQGKRRQALRMAELAVNFDPLNREAIELRSDIWLGKPCMPPCEAQPQGMPPAGAIDGQQLPPWLLQQLGNPAAPSDSPKMEIIDTPIPTDTGIPGTRNSAQNNSRNTSGTLSTLPMPPKAKGEPRFNLPNPEPLSNTDTQGMELSPLSNTSSAQPPRNANAPLPPLPNREAN